MLDVELSGPDDGEPLIFHTHGRWLAENVAGARAHLPAEHGHLSLAIDCYGAVLDDLLRAAGGEAR